jgi:prolyl oligopeptidase
VGATPVPQGALIALDAKDLAAGRPPTVELLLAPGPRQSIEQVAITRSRVVVTLYDHVKGSLWSFARGTDGWTRTAIPVAQSAAVEVSASSDLDDTLYVNVEASSSQGGCGAPTPRPGRGCP